MRLTNQQSDTMNIYANSGDKVRFTNTGGYDSDKDHARRFLRAEQIYTVDHTEVGSWRTAVYLREVPGESFNSVMFVDA